MRQLTATTSIGSETLAPQILTRYQKPPGMKLQGTHALVAREPGIVTAAQIKSARLVIARTISRRGKLWIRTFPDMPVTGKSVGVRMGKGKGTVKYWVSYVRAGQLLFEIDGVQETLADQALSKATYKFGIKTKVVMKGDPWLPSDKVSQGLPGGRMKPKPMFWCKKHFRKGKLDTRA